MKKSYTVTTILILIVLYSCSNRKLQKSDLCSRQYVYSTKKLDITGITAKLKKAGVEFADLGITSIIVDPKFVTASEKLQQLDLLQFNICQQLKSLTLNDSLNLALKKQYINALIDMMKIAQGQDSLNHNK
jgi:hypothetical protein